MVWLPMYTTSKVYCIDAKTAPYNSLLNQAEGMPVTINSFEFQTTWHMYYALLFDDVTIQRLISTASTHTLARRIAATHSDKIVIRDSDQQYALMSWCIRYKIYTYPKLADLFKDIPKGMLICYVNREDARWGCITSAKAVGVVCGNNDIGDILNQLKREIDSGSISMFIFDRYIVNNEIVSQPTKKIVAKQKSDDII